MNREELKPIDLECNMGPDVNGVVQREPWKAYDIDEVDRLLDEKDKEIARLNDKALQYKALDKEHCRDLNTQERRFALQIAHQKYKRCLAMAKWCELKSFDAADYRIPRRKWDFYDKWHMRWLELAEKFKPNNSTAQ